MFEMSRWYFWDTRSIIDLITIPPSADIDQKKLSISFQSNRLCPPALCGKLKTKPAYI